MKDVLCSGYLPYALVTVNVAVWPALPNVPLHPSENVVVMGAITETVLLPRFATYMNPLSSLKAMPIGCVPTGMGGPTTVFVAWFRWWSDGGQMVTKKVVTSLMEAKIKAICFMILKHFGSM